MKTPQTLVELVQSQAKTYPNKVLYQFLKNGEIEEAPFTFADLDKRSRAIAVLLQKAGAKGERALLCYPPGLEYITAFFGCLYAGATPVPSYPPNPSQLTQSLSRLKPILTSSRAKFILTTTQLALIGRFLPGKPAELKGIEWLSTDKAKDSLAGEWQDPKVTPSSIAFLQYTSGSTGNPKGVMVSHANLIHNLKLGETVLHLTPEDRAVIWLPPYHDLGLIGGIMQPIFSGLTCYLMSPLDFLKRPARWLEAMTKYQGTISGGPGFAYDLCAKKIPEEERRKYNLSKWRVAFIGAEPVRASTVENFSEVMKPQGFNLQTFYPTYGMAENTLFISGAFSDRHPVFKRLMADALENDRVVEASSNLPKNSTDVRVFVGNGVSPDDQLCVIVNHATSKRCKPDQIGEIWISGPCKTQGYWERPKETEETFHARIHEADGTLSKEDYLRTGDLGFIDSDGEVYITGRVKDLIIIRGKNFYPQDLEATAFHSHSSLRPGGTIAFSGSFSPGNTGGEELVVVAEVARSFDPKKDRSGDQARTMVEEIRKTIFRDHDVRATHITLIRPGSLPKTSSGKLARAETKKKWIDKKLELVFEWNVGDTGTHELQVEETSESATAESSGTLDDLSQWLMKELSRESAVPLHDVKLTSKLGYDLAMDSLMLMNLYGTITTFFPSVQLDDITTDSSVDDLLTALRAQGITKPVPLKPVQTEIPESSYTVELFPEALALAERFQMIATANAANPYMKSHLGPSRDTLVLASDHREMINYSGYNYVGMSGDPIVNEASKKAIDLYGTSVSASRLASGEIPLHQELEKEIAQFLGADDAIVFVAGHPTNVTTIGHVVGSGDLILHDALSHDSIMQGAKLSGAQRRSFPHNDFKALEQTLEKIRPLYRRVLIVIEAVYSMDGDIAHLPEFIALKKKYKAMLFVDEAHSIGVLGKTGRGIIEHFGVKAQEVDFLMGTHSKALASCGGYVASSKAMIQFLKYTAPGFVYSVGIPPSNAAAALEALKLLQKQPERLARLRDNSKLFLTLTRDAGLDTGPSEGTPIVPVIIGDSVKCLRLANRLNERGINVQPILYPAVPEASTRLRFFITSCHTEEQIRKTVKILAEESRL